MDKPKKLTKSKKQAKVIEVSDQTSEESEQGYYQQLGEKANVGEDDLDFRFCSEDKRYFLPGDYSLP